MSALAGSAVARVVPEGSRDRQVAEAFARETGIDRAYGSYDEVLPDPDVDAAYIPLPNHLHLPWIERAAEGRPKWAIRHPHCVCHGVCDMRPLG